MIIHDLVSAFGCRSDRNASEKLKQMFRIRVSRAGLVMLILFGTLPLTSRTGGGSCIGTDRATAADNCQRKCNRCDR